MVNDTVLAKRINKALGAVLHTDNIISDLPAAMGSEDFNYLAAKKTKCDYVFVGTAGSEEVRKALAEGKQFPFTGHSNNYKVDLSAIPLGTVLGVLSLFEMFSPE